MQVQTLQSFRCAGRPLRHAKREPRRRALLIGIVALASTLPEVAHAEDMSIFADGPVSINYVPAPQPPPKKRKSLKQQNAEKPFYRRPWAMNDSRRGRWKGIGLGTAGVVVGFLAHEMGHVLMNLAYGNVPTLKGLRYGGFVPFFRISPGVRCNDDGCFKSNGEEFRGGRTGLYLITSAGFNVQHVINEILLSLDPNLQHHRSPFQKGLLFFNLSLSIGYSLSTWFQIDDAGDITGMANAAQLNPNWVALMVLIPTAFDVYRFFMPDSKWAPWVSRGSKVLFLGVSFIW